MQLSALVPQQRHNEQVTHRQTVLTAVLKGIFEMSPCSSSSDCKFKCDLKLQ